MPSMGHNVAEVMFLDINAKQLDLDLKKNISLVYHLVQINFTSWRQRKKKSLQ